MMHVSSGNDGANSGIFKGKDTPLFSSPSADGSLTLDKFIEVLTQILSTHEKGDANNEVVGSLFRRLVLSRDELARYGFVDQSKHYTRNLIATDHKTFTLILMCWTPGKEAPIHDHPCDGCWVRVMQGAVREVRFVKDDATDTLVCTSDITCHEGQFAFINDSLGYHKLGNPNVATPSFSLHLYCPPFDSCKIWLDPSKASKPSQAYACYYSKYGTKINEEVDGLEVVT